jgi:hypothetical protein
MLPIGNLLGQPNKVRVAPTSSSARLLRGEAAITVILDPPGLERRRSGVKRVFITLGKVIGKSHNCHRDCTEPRRLNVSFTIR